MPRHPHSAPLPDQRPTHTVEDYLMTMHVMERDYGEIVAARLAEMMNVAPATVAMTLKRMERDNWITGTGRKAVHLTPTGRQAAHSVTRRHMLTEWLLLRVLKVPLPQIHDEAHGIEHVISPSLEERLIEILDNPPVCPHGNPLPGFEHVVKEWAPLTGFVQGETGVIRRIHEFAEENNDLLIFLIENSVLPGTRMEVLDILPFNHTLTIQVKESPVTLGFAVASYIFAERLASGMPDDANRQEVV
jgi:DtxR family Mn-dependent transcriptional regulator